MNELFPSLNPWWTDESFPELVERKRYMQQLVPLLKTKDVIFLTGLRRVGKTTLLKQLIEELLSQGIPKEHVFYVSLDMVAFDDLYIQDIIKEYRRMHSIPYDTYVYVFLDEVTYKERFNQELKNLYDLGYCKVFASSSSASVLTDKRAFLTGRSRYIEIEPLDFDEFLLFKGYKIRGGDGHLTKNYFEEYMELGGMPEYVLTKDPTYITEMVNSIVLKDIVAKYGLRNKQQLYDLLKLLMERVGKTLSYGKIARVLDISKDSVQTYISYFVETYLFSIVEQEGKLNERIRANKKFYCADVGIKNVVTGFRDKGAIYENLVFLKLKHKNPRYFRKGDVEIDFIFDDYLIEAKFGQKLEDKQKKVFDSVKKKKKLVAQGVDFFTGFQEL